MLEATELTKSMKCSTALYELLPLGINHAMQRHGDKYDSKLIDRKHSAEEIFYNVKKIFFDEVISSPNIYHDINNALSQQVS